MQQDLGELIWIIRHGLPGLAGWVAVFIALVLTAVTIVRALGWLAGALAYSFRKLHECRLAWEELGFTRGGTLITSGIVAVVLALLALSLSH